MGRDATSPLDERIIGAIIDSLEVHRNDPSLVVLTFRHRGTDEDSGYLIVPANAVFFGDEDV